MSDGHDHLRAPYASASLRGYAGEVWERRDYVWYVPLSDLRSRHVNTVLGNLWHLLNPLLLIGVYFLIFGLLLKADRGVDNFIGFLAAGIFAFTYTQRTVQTSSSVMTRNIGLLNSFSFPRAILPLTSVVTEALAFVPCFLVMMTVAMLSGETARWSWLALPAILAWQPLFNFGAALIAARAGASLRDLQNLLPFAFRLLFYRSGVLFSVEAYVDSEVLAWLFYLNPLFAFLSLYRWAVPACRSRPEAVLLASVWTAALLTVGSAWFRRAERTFSA